MSVIIPAYNAERFLRLTVASAQAQNYPSLEIIVVDDGSLDGTAAIAQKVAQLDPRVKLVRQQHAGVAMARNRGIAESQGEFIAPLDADDLWHPENVRVQVAALDQAGPETAVSYAWYVSIDEHGDFLKLGPENRIERKNAVLAAQIAGNFIGNASSTVIRRDAIEAVGGYDPRLHASDAQGCEDQALYIALAERWDFVAVPQYVVAYRNHPGSMCRDAARMARSQAMVLADLHNRRPELPGYWYGRGMSHLYESQLMAALMRYDLSLAAGILSRASVDGRWCVLELLLNRIPKRVVSHWVRRFSLHSSAPVVEQEGVKAFWAAPQNYPAPRAMAAAASSLHIADHRRS